MWSRTKRPVTLPPSRSSSRRPGPPRFLGPLLATAWGVLWLGIGGLIPSVRVAVHLLLAVAFGLLLWKRDVHGRLGWLVRWSKVTGVLLAGASLALLPLPAGVRGWVAPANPITDGWWPSSIEPWRGVNGLSELMLMLSLGALAAAWAELRYRRRRQDRVLMVSLTVVSVVALGHWAADAQSVFGLWRPRTDPDVLLGPLVNPNHLGALLLLMVPTAFAHMLRAGFSFPGVWGGCLCLVSGVLIAISGSWGIGLGLLMAGLVVLSRGRVSATRWMAVLVIVVWAGWAIVMTLDPALLSTSVGGRSEQWWVSRRVIHGFWLFGTGLNGYELAFPPFRSHGDLGWYAHVHNDLIEWACETGVMGVLACVAWLWVWPKETRDQERSIWLDAGLVGFFVACLVDFPLQIPALGGAAAMALAVRAGLHQSSRASSVLTARGVLVGMLALNVLGSAVALRTQLVESSRTAARAWSEDRQAAQAAVNRLAMWDADAPELSLVTAWEALAGDDLPGAVLAVAPLESAQGLGATQMRQVALILGRANEVDRALALLDRAVLRDPGDYRTALLQAQLHEEQGNIELALEAWGRTLRLAPPSGVLLDEALELLPEGIYWSSVLEEADPRWSLLLAQRMYQEDDWGTLRSALEVAARHPHWADPPLLSLAMVKTGDSEAGLQMAKRLTQDDPEDSDAWLYLGRVYRELEQYADARDAFVRATRKDKRARIEAVWCAYEVDGRAGAEAMLQRFKNTGLFDDRLFLEQARLMMREGEWASCVSVIEIEGLVDKDNLAEEAERLRRRCALLLLP